MDDKNMRSLNDLAVQIKNVETGVNNMIVPLLKDTIADTNKHNQRLFSLCIIALLVILATGIYSIYIVANQNEKYTEFLSQFEFTSDEIYQELDTYEGGNAIINSGITVHE